jgi:hypothetical protein
MGAGSGSFNRHYISITFSDDILNEFTNIKNKYFLKEDGSFYIDLTILNCKAMPDALNYINYYNYSTEKKIQIYNIVYSMITNNN